MSNFKNPAPKISPGTVESIRAATFDHIYLWYCGAGHPRIVATGNSSQDAFTRLGPSEREQITVHGEFCVEISDQRDINAPYTELLNLYHKQSI